jgi:hypothetical protein
MIPAAFVGAQAVALAVFLALAIPAIAFNSHAVSELDLRSPIRGRTRELVLATAVTLALPGAVVALTSDVISPWGVLAVAVPVSAVTCAWSLLGIRSRERREVAVP